MNPAGETQTYCVVHDYDGILCPWCQVDRLTARVAELEAALARIDELMIRERQSNKDYVREVRRITHAHHGRAADEIKQPAVTASDREWREYDRAMRAADETTGDQND